MTIWKINPSHDKVLKLLVATALTGTGIKDFNTVFFHPAIQLLCIEAEEVAYRFLELVHFKKLPKSIAIADMYADLTEAQKKVDGLYKDRPHYSVTSTGTDDFKIVYTGSNNSTWQPITSNEIIYSDSSVTLTPDSIYSHSLYDSTYTYR